MILGDAAPEADEGKRQVGSVRCMEIDLKTTEGCSQGAPLNTLNRSSGQL